MTRRRRVQALVVVLALCALAAVPAHPLTAQGPAGDDGGVIRAGGEVLGTAESQVMTIIPIVNRGLQLPARFGASGARIDGQVRRASSAASDFGLLGTLTLLCLMGAPTLKTLGVPTERIPEFIPVPQPSVADSRDRPEVEVHHGVPQGSGPVRGGGGHERSVARPDGPATSRTEMNDMILDLGALTIEMKGGASETYADATTVRARTELGELRFLAAGLELGALRGIVWTFEQGLGQPSSASFTMGSSRFGGAELPAGSLESAEPLVGLLNTLLAPLGVSVTLPTLRPEGGMSALRVALLESPLGAQLIQPLFSGALSNAISQLEGAAVDVLPETGCAITPANVLVSAASGQGGIAVELGGASGSIGNRPVEEFVYGTAPAHGPTPDGIAAITGPAPGPSSGSTGQAVAVPPVPPAEQPSTSASGPPAGRATVAQRAVALVTDRSGVAIVIVLLGLAATLALVVVERRRIATMVEAPR